MSRNVYIAATKRQWKIRVALGVMEMMVRMSAMSAFRPIIGAGATAPSATMIFR